MAAVEASARVGATSGPEIEPKLSHRHDGGASGQASRRRCAAGFNFPVTEGVGRYDLGMDHYGVKLKSGKVLWVVADHVEVREGVVLFCRKEAEGNRVLAGFFLEQIPTWRGWHMRSYW